MERLKRLLKILKNSFLTVFHKIKNYFFGKNSGGLRKALFILICVFICTLFIDRISLARYVYDAIKNYYFETKNFYFECDRMKEEGASFGMDNWNGVDDMDVVFTMSSIKNNYVVSSSDIYYDISFSCSSNVSCTTVNPLTNNLISTVSHQATFTIKIHPIINMSEGEEAVLNIQAQSTSPYRKNLSGQIKLKVSNPGLSYEIVDKVGQPYFYFKTTNTLEYYHVIQAFSGHSVGQQISVADYNTLSSANKAKCTSAEIKLTFNPNTVLLDLSQEQYQKALNYTTTTIGGYTYVNSITFGMEPISSEMIRFYKVNASENYTYPYDTATSIVTFELIER